MDSVPPPAQRATLLLPRRPKPPQPINKQLPLVARTHDDATSQGCFTYSSIIDNLNKRVGTKTPLYWCLLCCLWILDAPKPAAKTEDLVLSILIGQYLPDSLITFVWSALIKCWLYAVMLWCCSPPLHFIFPQERAKTIKAIKSYNNWGARRRWDAGLRKKTSGFHSRLHFTTKSCSFLSKLLICSKFPFF